MKADIYLKRYLSDKERFTDLFNAVLFDGEEILKADAMSVLSGESALVLKDKNGKEVGVQRYRDILMKAENGMRLMLLAVENTRLKTDLRLFFGVLQYKEDRDGMRQYLYRHEKYFRNIDLDTYGAMNAVLGDLRRIDEEDAGCGGVDMCKAFEDMYLDGKSEGKAEGISLSILAILKNSGDLPENIAERIQAEKNLELLDTWLKKAICAEDMDEFVEYIKQQTYTY